MKRSLAKAKLCMCLLFGSLPPGIVSISTPSRPLREPGTERAKRCCASEEEASLNCSLPATRTPE
ncbi:MAG: hypothetical protein PHN61_00895 [Methanothrix sp.]|nr:hypothetical protein [Methanothrix sp.]